MNTTQVRQAGITLVELCVVLAVSAILFAVTVPSLAKMKRHLHLKSAAQTVVTDIQQARSEAVRRGTSVQLRFSEHPQGSCYIIHTGGPGQCKCQDDGKAVCGARGQLLKTAWIPGQAQTRVRSNVPNMNFDARVGSVSPAGSVDITDSHGENIRQVVSVLGRIRACTTSGKRSGLPNCNLKKA